MQQHIPPELVIFCYWNQQALAKVVKNIPSCVTPAFMTTLFSINISFLNHTLDTYMMSKICADYLLTCTSVDDFLWIHWT